MKILFKNPLLLEIIALFILLLVVKKVDASNEQRESFYFKKEDIYYEFDAAKQIAQGKNPYEKTLEGNMVENDKYATLFPLYYYFLGLIRNSVNGDFSDFLAKFRSILTLSRIVSGLAIYLMFRRIGKKTIGFIAASVYLLNLWSLESFVLLKQDAIAIALLLVSYYFFGRKNWVSYLLFGFSLGIKHIGIFIFPLYLTPLLFKEQKLKEFIFNMLLLFAPVVISSMPFLLSNPQSLLASLEFSFTRAPNDGQVIFGYQKLLVHYSEGGLNGTYFEFLLPRLPLLLAVMSTIYLLFTKLIPRSFYLFAGIAVFSIFNPVIFAQYVTWLTPLIFLGILDFYKQKELKV